MNALERMLGEFAAQAAPAPRQVAAAAALREAALPSRRDENWHYANLRALDSLARFAPTAQAGDAARSTGRPLPDPLPEFTRLVLRDGRLQTDPAHGNTPALMRLEGPAASESWGTTSNFEQRGDGRFGLVSQLFSTEFLALRANGQQRLEIVYFASAGAPAHYADVAIDVAAGAQLELVERHLGESDPDRPAANSVATEFGCHRLRVRLASGARLRHTRLQQAEETALLFDTAAIHLGEHASYRLHDVSAGAGSARATTQIVLAGAESSVQIGSLSTVRSGQRSDAQYTILHEARGTRSDVSFRGSASDRSHVACTADVQVTPRAPGSRVQQSLRGLVDGKGAEVDLRPRLTIDTNEIQASHGATTGRLDDDVLFYLLARGLAPEAARSLLKWAFLAETLGAIEPAALRREAERATARRLTDAPAAELLQ